MALPTSTPELVQDVKEVRLALKEGLIKDYKNQNFTDYQCIKSGYNSSIWKVSYKQKKVMVLKESTDVNSLINEIKVYYACATKRLAAKIIRIFGISEISPKQFVLVMEHAQRGNLKDLIENETLSWEAKTRLSWNIIESLNALHKAGYIHRDLHSKNVLCFEENEKIIAKIADFGFSYVAKNNDQATLILGVLPYIAPEVLEKNETSYASDIYSFGIIMAELSKNTPFEDYQNSVYTSLKVLNGWRPELAPDTPEFYSNLYESCVRKDPGERFTTQEIYEKLKESLSDMDSSNKNYTFWNKIKNVSHKFS